MREVNGLCGPHCEDLHYHCNCKDCHKYAKKKKKKKEKSGN